MRNNRDRASANLSPSADESGDEKAHIRSGADKPLQKELADPPQQQGVTAQPAACAGAWRNPLHKAPEGMLSIKDPKL